VTLSLLLILGGLVTFVVFLTDPSADRWTEAGRLIGATLFQVGVVTLLLELVHLERLLGTKVPEALLEGGYLDHLKDDRLDDLIERVIRARFSGMNVDDVNATSKPVLINGDGVVQAFRNTIPDTLEFARRFRSGALTPADELAWVNAMARPTIELRPSSGTSPLVVDPEIDNLVVTSGDEGRLLLAFDVKCAHLVLPGERVKVTYRHREYVDRRGYFPWRATARTYNLRVKTIGFEGFDTYPIPSPSLPSEDDKLEVFDNGIYYRGVLYPNSTFTFFWTERASSGKPATGGR